MFNMDGTYLPADYLYMFISYILTTIAITRAGILDHTNIFSNQASNYILLLISLAIMFTEYIAHPELALANIIILAVYSTTISIYITLTSRRLFGNTDIIFTHIYIFSTPPLILPNRTILPYSGIVVLTSTFLAIHKIYYKKQIGTPFLTQMAYIHLTLLPLQLYTITIKLLTT